MLEDMAWPATPSGAFLRTGIYIEGTVPITMCQWAWIHHAQGGQRHLVTATATSTTDQFPFVADDIVTIVPTIEVAL